MDENMLEQGVENTEEAQAASVEKQAGTQDYKGQEAEQEKKYTDADVDKIVARKIAAERKRMSKIFNEEQQENELEVRERNVLRRELMADAKDLLINDGFPSSLAKLLNYDSEESFGESYKEMTGIFNDAVQTALKDRLRGHTPIRGMTSGNKELTREKAFADAFAPNVR